MTALNMWPLILDTGLLKIGCIFPLGILHLKHTRSIWPKNKLCISPSLFGSNNPNSRRIWLIIHKIYINSFMVFCIMLCLAFSETGNSSLHKYLSCHSIYDIALKNVLTLHGLLSGTKKSIWWKCQSSPLGKRCSQSELCIDSVKTL